MKNFHISTEDGKNSHVLIGQLKATRPTLVKVSENNELLQSVNVLRGDTNVKLTSELIADTDEDINIADIGREIQGSSAYHRRGSSKVEGGFSVINRILDTKGNETERKPHVARASNIDATFPVKIRKRMPAADAFQQFVFRRQYLLVHDDGLKYEFLHGLAKSLADKKEVALLGAGPKGTERLVCSDGDLPYQGFLYGEVNGDKYRLYLLLTKQELKMPVRETEEPKTEENPRNESRPGVMQVEQPKVIAPAPDAAAGAKVVERYQTMMAPDKVALVETPEELLKASGRDPQELIHVDPSTEKPNQANEELPLGAEAAPIVKPKKPRASRAKKPKDETAKDTPAA